MESFNLLKNINIEIDNHIKEYEKNLKSQNLKSQNQFSTKGTILDPTFFVNPQHLKKKQKKHDSKLFQQSQKRNSSLLRKLQKIVQQQTSTKQQQTLTKQQQTSTKQQQTSTKQTKQTKQQNIKELDITKLKKSVLFNIMKALMLEYYNNITDNSCCIQFIKYIIKNIKINDISLKIIKNKIVIFSELMNVPIKFQKKQLKYNQQKYIIPLQHNNIIQKKLNNIFNFPSIKLVPLNNPMDPMEPIDEFEYFLYCILYSIKKSNVYIPVRLYGLKFSDIYQSLNSKTYPNIIKFISETFPNTIFIIREFGYSSIKSKQKYKRDYIINRPTQSIYQSGKIKIYIIQKTIAKPYNVAYELISQRNQIEYLTGQEIFCN